MLESKRHKWLLHADPSIDYDDVANRIRFHIYKKIDQFKEEEGEIGAWLNTLISNQLLNIQRDTHGHLAKKCRSQSCIYCDSGREEECPEYQNWVKNKKSKFDIKLPLSIEHHTQEVYDKPSESLDYNHIQQEIAIKIKSILTKQEFRVYKCLFIQFKTESETNQTVRLERGISDSANLRKISILKKRLISMAKEIIIEEGY